MKIEELQKICKEPNKKKKYSWHDYYGLGYCIKEYAKFPKFLNLEVYTDHGPGLRENLLPPDLNHKQRVSLLQNTLRIKAFQKIGKSAYCTGSPFVHYRKKKNIHIKQDAKGTVCFPFHSTKSVKANFDIDKLIKHINDLPQRFQPVTICLHHCDVEDGKHLKYIEKGFNVVSAGHKFDKKFVHRFYEILSNHLYATSNGYGSHVPYCIEMGLPFFYTGSGEIKMNNKGNTSVKLGISSLDDYVHSGRIMNKYDEALILFKDFKNQITKEQKTFAESVLGIHTAISPQKLNRILWTEFFYFNWMNIKHAIKMILLKMKLYEKIKKISE